MEHCEKTEEEILGATSNNST